MDLDRDDANILPLAPDLHEPWSRYPQSHFGNWTQEQVGRCHMLTICKDEGACQIHKVDVREDGTFEKLEEEAQTSSIPRDDTSARQFWDDLHKPVGVLPPLLCHNGTEGFGRSRPLEYGYFSSRISPRMCYGY